MASVVIRSSISNEIFYSTKSIEINKKKLSTPFAVLNPAQKKVNIPPESKNILLEYWKSINIQEVKDAPISHETGLLLTKRIQSAVRGSMPNEPRVFYLNLKGFNPGSNPLTILDEGLIKSLLDAYYLFTNVIAFPIIQKITNIITSENLCEIYEDYIQKCYEIAETLNTKPLMGIIPPIPQNFVSRIVKKYLSLEITNFCFDFEGSGLSTYFPNYREFIRTLYLNDKDAFADNLIAITNLKLPSNTNRNQPFPADDMITPAIGVDIVGINHASFGRKDLPSVQMGGRPKKKTPVRMNLLDVQDYTYHRVGSLDEFNQIFKDPVITP